MLRMAGLRGIRLAIQLGCGMKCPNCGYAELENFGDMRECPRCHFTTYFNMTRSRFAPEPDFGFDF